jgi:hypothetical protein
VKPRLAQKYASFPPIEHARWTISFIDLFSRRLLGYATGERHDAELVVGSLNMAAATRGGDVKGVIFHSDRGSEGGFNWSSQHLDHGGGDGPEQARDAGGAGGCSAAVGSGSGAAATDAFPGAAGAVSRGAAGVLAPDRVGGDDG